MDAYDRFADRLALMWREFWESATSWRQLGYTALFTAIWLMIYGAAKGIEALL